MTIITRAERRVLREHRATTIEARVIHERLREHGRAFCRGCSRVKDIAGDFYRVKVSKDYPRGHSHRCRRCADRATMASRARRKFVGAAPFVAADDATRRSRDYRNVARSITNTVTKRAALRRLVRLDVPVKQYAATAPQNA